MSRCGVNGLVFGVVNRKAFRAGFALVSALAGSGASAWGVSPPEEAERVAAPAPGDANARVMDAGQVLTRAREAAAAHREVEVELTGNATLFALEQTGRLRLGGRDGAGAPYAWLIDGRVPWNRGWDGRGAWQQEFHDRPRRLVLREEEDARILGALLSGGWAEGGLELDEAGARAADGVIVTPFTLPRTLMRGELSIDAATARVRSATWGTAPETQTLTIREWREVEGRLVPGEFGLSQAGNEVTTKLTTGGVVKGVMCGPESAAGDGATGSRTSFAAARGMVDVKRAKTGHLLVKPRFAKADGTSAEPAGWFIFDTGAGATVIDRKAAEALKASIGLEEYGAIPVAGLGGFVTAPLAEAGSMTLGPVTIERPIMLALDLGMISAAMGEAIDGVIGYDLLHRVVTRLDTVGGTLELLDPATLDTAGAEWLPMLVYERRPVVEARFEVEPAREGAAAREARGWFMLDTGAGNQGVSFYGPAVESLRLLEGREVKDSMSGGVGGMRASKRGTLGWVELGSHRHEQVPAEFRIGAVAAAADTATLGLIGGGVLKRYVMTFDYAGGRIALEDRKVEAH